MSTTFDTTWIWHPNFNENERDTAGRLVHFRRHFIIDENEDVPKTLKIRITADTKYRLYVNHQLVTFGPVKGDRSMWFFDEVDIAAYLRKGINHVGVHVLRLFFSTQYAPSFPRLPTGGLQIIASGESSPWKNRLDTSELWETSIDPFCRLRVDEPEDVFLHIYEAHSRVDADLPLEWMPAQLLKFKNSTGNSPPWHLSPRLIPNYRIETASFEHLHNLHSKLPVEDWTRTLLKTVNDDVARHELRLAPGSRHQFDLEVAQHMTGFIRALFQRPVDGGGYIKLTYSESYEDEPDLYKGMRNKAYRCDATKQLLGPHDLYQFQGETGFTGPGYYDEEEQEIFSPFHIRTFRFIRVEICAGPAPLVFRGLEIESAHYPLDVTAKLAVEPRELASEADLADKLWTTSIRTLVNCMHDCYEDCPFYEQMQYAMDSRSSALFTYCISGDDSMARQAIIQLHNSFQPRLGLTASRAPTHREQFIPHFSLYWICMLYDHYQYCGDEEFLTRFTAVADAVLSYFGSRVDPEFGLVKTQTGTGTGIWNFIDWTEEWKPYGCPTVCEQTGFSTFTNELYAYTLNAAADLISALGRPALGDEYRSRAKSIIVALREHCFDGDFFTDSLVSAQSAAPVPYSQHSQIWAVLSGASSGSGARALLRKTLEQTDAGNFVRASVSMSFYTMRALSVAGAKLYDDHFHHFWQPWQKQLDLGLTTWFEDDIAQRSDCHAWGSVPLYEFMAEVAGVTPAEPEWQAIKVAPRLSLYPNLKASVPIGSNAEESIGLIHVSWTKVQDQNEVNLSLRGEKVTSRPTALEINLPGQVIRMKWTGLELNFTVKI